MVWHLSRDPVTGPGAAEALTTGSIGHDVFSAAYHKMAVFSDRIVADGFEEGDTSRWDDVSP